MVSYRAPKVLDHKSSIQFSIEVRDSGPRTDFLLDLSKLEFVTPVGMLVLLDALQRRSVGCKWRYISGPAEGYLTHFGFFDALKGIGKRDEPSQTDQLPYLPITQILVSDLRERARAELILVQEHIARWSGVLATSLLQRQDGEAWKLMQFSFQELIRNVVEHSQADRLLVAAQHWPAREEAEIVLVDGGIGVAKSLRRNPELRVESDRHAVQLAVLPGVSGNRSANRDSDDMWRNTGFGLFMTSSIARSNGFFLLSSGSACLTLDHAGKQTHETPPVGTMVGMRMTTSASQLRAIKLPEIAAAGERLAARLTEEGRSPSAASSALRWEDV